MQRASAADRPQLAVVIPARNEAATIADVIGRALRLPGAVVIPVVNGSTDMTRATVERVRDRRIQPLYFREPLGYDVPRIAGARRALDLGVRWVLFADGDLTGRLEPVLFDLAAALRHGADMALTDCYANTAIPTRETVAKRVYQTRLRLNQVLGRDDLGPAIPSHGPAGVSRRLIETVSLQSLGIPPLAQSEAVRSGLRVEIGARIPHLALGSAHRDLQHRLTIAETIMGDCEEARCFAEGVPRDRGGHIGYHQDRRFDLVGIGGENGAS